MSSPTPSLSSLPKTTVIINNLAKNDFIINESASVSFGSKKLALVDQIKLAILNLKSPQAENNDDDAYLLNRIEYWSNLPFLNRVIIIFEDEASALDAFQYLAKTSELTRLFPQIKITLQENLLSRSKSFDSLIKTDDKLSVSQDLSNFKNKHDNPELYQYSEPEPHQFNAYADLSKIGVDVSAYNSPDQLKELKDDSRTSTPGLDQTTPAPSQVMRSRSMTKTLFKPNLTLNTTTVGSTKGTSPVDYPLSPTITLDETF